MTMTNVLSWMSTAVTGAPLLTDVILCFANSHYSFCQENKVSVLYRGGGQTHSDTTGHTIFHFGQENKVSVLYTTHHSCQENEISGAYG